MNLVAMQKYETKLKPSKYQMKDMGMINFLLFVTKATTTKNKQNDNQSIITILQNQLSNKNPLDMLFSK